MTNTTITINGITLPTTFVDESYKFIFIVLALLLTWFIGNRISYNWAIHQKKKEIEIDTLNEFYQLYGQFFSNWKLWRQNLKNKCDIKKKNKYEEIKHEIEERSFIAEGQVEAILVKITSEKMLNDTQLEILGRFRQAYQRLREYIRGRKRLTVV